MPASIVALVAFGAAHPHAVGPRFWRQVALEVQDWIDEQLPPGARDLVIALDDEALEVVVSRRR